MSMDLEVRDTSEVEPIASPTLFGTNEPGAVIERASEVAKHLAKAVKNSKLSVKIQGRDYVLVEGWEMLGAMLGVSPVVTEMHKLVTEGGGWEAYVEARTRSGEVVGGAWGQCMRDEKSWKGREDYALRSMAQTRATSKALRMAVGFVMPLAGFAATPAEEMPDSGERSTFKAPTDAPKATKAQVEKIETQLDAMVLADKATRQELDQRLESRYLTSKAAELTKAQADELLELLKAS